MKGNIVVLLGPTASGKTEMGIRIAKRINGVIISADSMQVYKYMDIGTAKPTVEEMEGIPHYMIDVVEPDEDFSVAVFKELSEECIDSSLSSGKVPIVVGGTGLYINSLIQPWNFSKTKSDPMVRKELKEIAQKFGNEHIHSCLKKVDPESASAIHPNNVKRVIRALEVYKITGKKKSELDRDSMKHELKYRPVIMGLTMNREKLYSRINSRVDVMLKSGLVDEVRKLLNMGYGEDLVSMQGLGYKEIVKYLKGEYSLLEAADIIKRDTRHFAKRQLTWFKRDDRIKWFDVDKYENTDDLEIDMINYLKDEGIF